jgi:drug efflux transport system ATP-binding protein
MIEVQGLVKHFGDMCAVDHLQLRVLPGEVYGLVGPDGAGKTTSLRLLCGALLPDEGTIKIAGYSVISQTEIARAQIGYLPQRFSLYEELTVLENLRFFAEVRGLKSSNWRPRCMEILKFVGLDEFINRRAGHLSGGMKQKLGLAVALVHQPKVLLLDEPTTGVDPVTRQDFWKLIIRLAAGDEISVLVTTPYMDEAARCSQVGFMTRGHILVEGMPQELNQRLEGRVIELMGVPLTKLRMIALKIPGVEDAQMFGDRLHIRVGSGALENVMQNLNQEIPKQDGQVYRLRAIPPQLEDVFMDLLRISQDAS